MFNILEVVSALKAGKTCYCINTRSYFKQVDKGRDTNLFISKDLNFGDSYIYTLHFTPEEIISEWEILPQ